MDHENNSDSKNGLSLDDRKIYRDPPGQPLTPEEVEAALARNEAYYAPLIAAEKARKAEEKKAAEKA